MDLVSALGMKKKCMNTDITDLWNMSGFAIATRPLGFVRQSKENFKSPLFFLFA